jgi:hypothetical protein
MKKRPSRTRLAELHFSAQPVTADGLRRRAENGNPRRGVLTIAIDGGQSLSLTRSGPTVRRVYNGG